MASADGQTILCVEDEVLVRLVAAEFFRDHGFRVLEAATAAEALTFLQCPDLEIDVLFSDIRLPGEMDGVALADWTRKHCPRIPVLLVSGYHQHHSFDGRFDIISKPYSFERILDRVQQMLEDNGSDTAFTHAISESSENGFLR